MKKASILRKCAAFVSFAALLGLNFTISSVTLPGIALLLLLLAAAVWYFPAPDAIQNRYLCPGLLVCLGCSTNFYDSWIAVGAVVGIFQQLGIRAKWPILAASLCVAVIAVPAASWLIQSFSQAIRKTWRSGSSGGNFSWNTGFCALFGVYSVGLIALIRANFYYLDDIGRVTYGYKQFRTFGRHVSAVLSNYVHMDTYLTDVAPLPQLLAAAILALTAIVILRVVTGHSRFSLWELLAAVPIGLNPYFLECLSYRYDSPYMAFSLLAAASALLVEGGWMYYLAASLGSLLVCCSYQASTGIFPMLVMILILQKWCRRERFGSIWHFLWVSVAAFGTGIGAYRLAFVIPASTDYVSSDLPSAASFLPTLLSNYKHFYGALLSDFRPVWLIAAAAAAVVFLWVCLKKSRQPKWATAALSLLTLLFMLLMSFGLYPALANTLFAPRSMYGFCVLLSILCIVGCGEKHLLARLPALVLAWSFLTFSFTYGDALALQKDYTDYRITQVLSDLNDLSVSKEDPELEIQFTGSIGQAPALRNMPDSYRLLDRLVPETFAGENDWNYLRFFYFYDLANAVPRQDLRELSLPLLEDHMLHTIYGDGHRFLIHLK